MKYKLKSSNHFITLDKRNFKASGGEGDIYVKSDVVYKICYDGKMIPSGKIQELQFIQHSNVITPLDILIDDKQNEVGYTLKYIADSEVLCKLFNKSYRERNKIENQIVLNLVAQMRSTIEHIHSKNTLIVDLNELNFLIDQQYKNVFFIDTNSYQTKSYPATAIMDSIRDRHNKKFSTLTDWFSFGIISFQMIVGIHPFRGKHPQYHSLDDRMNHNLSILDSSVTYPKNACYDLTNVPSNYREWFKKIFGSIDRLPPPINFTDVITVQQVKVIHSDNIFNIEEIDKQRGFIHCEWLDYPVIFDPLLKTVTINGMVFQAEQYTIYKNNCYIKSGEVINKVIFDRNFKALVYTRKIADCLNYATTLYDGVALENVFGDYHAIIFSAQNQCLTIKLDGLFRYKILDAKYSNGILKVIGEKSGQYTKFTYKIDGSDYFVSFDKSENTTEIRLNFTVLDNGVCVEIVNNTLTLSKGDQTKIITSDQIDNWELDSIKNQVLIYKDNKTYKVSMI